MDMSYLMQRGEVWWYNRRIPKKYAHLDTRRRIRILLDTYAREETCMLRDKLVGADNCYWRDLALTEINEDADHGAVKTRYASAINRAQLAGFEYRPVEVIAEAEALPETLERLIAVRDGAVAEGVVKPTDAEALLGGAAQPKGKLSEVLCIYFDEIALNDQMYKSEAQKASWRKVKALAVTLFIDMFGDLPIDEITRDHALAYKVWWARRVMPDDPGTARNKENRTIKKQRTQTRETIPR